MLEKTAVLVNTCFHEHCHAFPIFWQCNTDVMLDLSWPMDKVLSWLGGKPVIMEAYDIAYIVQLHRDVTSQVPRCD